VGRQRQNCRRRALRCKSIGPERELAGERRAAGDDRLPRGPILQERLQAIANLVDAIGAQHGAGVHERTQIVR
jgi:hypothetical protein